MLFSMTIQDIYISNGRDNLFRPLPSEQFLPFAWPVLLIHTIHCYFFHHILETSLFLFDIPLAYVFFICLIFNNLIKSNSKHYVCVAILCKLFQSTKSFVAFSIKNLFFSFCNARELILSIFAGLIIRLKIPLNYYFINCFLEVLQDQL